MLYNFDAVLSQVGDMGRYQFFVGVFVYSLWIVKGGITSTLIFQGVIPSYQCAAESKTNETKCISSNKTIPSVNQCHHMNQSTVNVTTDEECRFGYEYDCSIWKNTITTEWDLVCDRRTLLSLATSLFFCGKLTAALFGGYLSDRYGRRLVGLVASIGMIASHILCYFSSSLEMFCASRFFIPMFGYVPSVCLHVYLLEVTNKKWRYLIGINTNACFGLGITFMTFFAYFVRTWKNLELVIICLLLPFPIGIYFLPESPRWLFATRNDAEAKKSLGLIARINVRRGIEEDEWTKFGLEDKSKPKKLELKDVIKFPTLMKYLAIMMFQWFATGLVYYGLTLNVGAFSSNIFINTAINGILEFLGANSCFPLLKYFGCRRTVISMTAACGIACVLSMLSMSENEALIKLGVCAAIVGKFTISAVFAAIYLHAPEVFPTDMRSTTIGLCSVAARVGSILTPFSLQVQQIYPWFIQTTFGCVAILAAIFNVILPETHKKPLLTTSQEAELLYSKKKEGSKDERMKNVPEEDDALRPIL